MFEEKDLKLENEMNQVLMSSRSEQHSAFKRMKLKKKTNQKTQMNQTYSIMPLNTIDIRIFEIKNSHTMVTNKRLKRNSLAKNHRGRTTANNSSTRIVLKSGFSSSYCNIFIYQELSYMVNNRYLIYQPPEQKFVFKVTSIMNNTFEESTSKKN